MTAISSPSMWFGIVLAFLSYIFYQLALSYTPLQRPERIVQYFNTLSTAYDGSTKFSSLFLINSWRNQAIDALNLQTSSKILDAATGTGETALLTAQRVRSLMKPEDLKAYLHSYSYDPCVYAVDFSPQMAQLTQDKVVSRKFEKSISVQLMSLEALAHSAEDVLQAGEYFDGAVLTFAVRHLSSRPAVLKEIHRQLKPGGKLVVLEAVSPTGLLSFPLQLYIAAGLPVLNAILRTDSSYFSHSILSWTPSVDAFTEELTEQGFLGCTTSNVFLQTIVLWTCVKGSV
jgi:demethylmenaquinone methyltransferase/2-methoxy-6-polyprenyl-1,4-benzoquinol methylase